MLAGLLIFVPLYGCPALVIREVARRFGLGWLGIVLLERCSDFLVPPLGEVSATAKLAHNVGAVVRSLGLVIAAAPPAAAPAPRRGCF